MQAVRSFAFFAWVLVAMPAIACSVVQDRIGIDAPPEDQFPAVGEYLGHRCGTLDCHGQPGRNLRIWGCWGMRLEPDASTSCTPPPAGPAGAGPSTPEEYDATYRSLVGLEPAVMSVVVQSHATMPEQLTFMRKAEGIESHKGGHVITPGDDQYKCVVSWLAGMTDMTACLNALSIPTFLQPSAPPQQDASL
jgi:hypothetical protein